MQITQPRGDRRGGPSRHAISRAVLQPCSRQRRALLCGPERLVPSGARPLRDQSLEHERSIIEQALEAHRVDAELVLVYDPRLTADPWQAVSREVELQHIMDG